MPAPHKPDYEELDRKNKKVMLMVAGLFFFMVGLTAISVPLYNLFCKVTGFGGETQVAERSSGEILDRKILVKFNTAVSPDLNWAFTPDQREVEVNLGQEMLVSFTAKNIGQKPSAGVALFNVTPPKLGQFFSKIQCFCFDDQTLQPGQQVHMPVLFFVDPRLDEDKNMDEVEVVTLSYKFYKKDSEKLDQAYENF